MGPDTQTGEPPKMPDLTWDEYIFIRLARQNITPESILLAMLRGDDKELQSIRDQIDLLGQH
jgi:hypothetical protein